MIVKPDRSMELLRLMGQHLVSREAALKFTEHVLRDTYGDHEMKLQSPLAIHDNAETWLIVGCKRKNIGATCPAHDVRETDIHVVISKFDGQILKLTFEGALTPLDRDGKPFAG